MAIFSRKLNGITVPKQVLLDEYTPHYIHPRKRFFFEQAQKFHKIVEGDMEISRFAFNEIAFEGGYPFVGTTTVSTDPSYYDYKKDISNPERYVVYVNFADYLLFGFYDDGKFAQDEIQTTEHPLLGSVVRYLDDKKIPNMETYTAIICNKVSSPYLVENVPYWISINTSVKMPDGSVHNLYGHSFSTESDEVVSEGVRIIEEEINDNILAIAAPNNFQNDKYSFTDLKYIIESLLTAFSATVEQAKKKGAKEVVIHTGNLGCGAFGGNPILMYLSQFIAGNMTGVTELIFHAPIEDAFNKAKEYYNSFVEKVVNGGPEVVKGKVCSMKSIVDFLSSYNFLWGSGNGT